MPSNKQRDLKKKEVEKTTKNQIVYHAVSICPVIEKDVTVFKIMKIGFTLSGECVTLEEVDRATSEAAAMNKFQVEVVHSGTLELKHIRALVKQVKEDADEKKAAE